MGKKQIKRMVYFVIALAAVSVFFLIIPAFGAFRVRRKWRLFRSRIIQASYFPRASYEGIRSQDSGVLGNFRMFGTIQALQDDSVLWVANKNLSVTVNLGNVTIYQLPASPFSVDRNSFSDESVQVMESRKIGTLPQGTNVMISGPLFVDNGLGVFQDDNTTPVTILFYEGDEKSILRRTIWGGRQKNEYWNPLTPGSMLVGVISLLALGYIQVRTPALYLQSVFTFALALLPVIPFLPPGILLFYGYTVFWKRARVYRGERDLYLLPLRFFPYDSSSTPEITVKLPDGEKYARQRFNDLQEAVKAVPEGYVHHFPLPGKKEENPKLHGFGVVRNRKDGKLYEPADPMVESLIIPGNPVELSSNCVQLARRQEIFSALAISTALVMNFTIIFFIVYLLIR
jgi:hypothetical protein